MSRNGSGTYTLPSGNPVVTGTTISSTWANNTLTDIATALSGSIAADGQTPITGSLIGTSGTVTFGGTGQTKIPSGTTAQRSASPSNGMLRFNTTLNAYEGYVNTAWVTFNPAGTQSYQTATQGQTVFTGLSYTTGNNSLKVYVNGSKQIVTLNYTETSSSSITFSTGLNVGDIVEFVQ
jgi:hypothetical protein